LKSIKAIPETRSIPIILISDKLSNEEEENVFNMGFFDYIPKPIKDITLISRVKRAINYYDQMLGISPE
jgi:PleD family two-component response regulator